MKTQALKHFSAPVLMLCCWNDFCFQLWHFSTSVMMHKQRDSVCMEHAADWAVQGWSNAWNKTLNPDEWKRGRLGCRVEKMKKRRRKFILLLPLSFFFFFFTKTWLLELLTPLDKAIKLSDKVGLCCWWPFRKQMVCYLSFAEKTSPCYAIFKATEGLTRWELPLACVMTPLCLNPALMYYLYFS